MKIVIDIPKYIYEHAKKQSADSYDKWVAMRAIANGTPLPKHHGRIIDESKINKVFHYTEEVINNNIKCINTRITHTDAPTIIEGSDSK